MPSGLGVMWAGVAIMFVGFAAKWTDRTFGIAQVLSPDLFESIGTWVMRAGLVVTAAGAVVWVAATIG